MREIEERYEDEFWQPFPRARQLPEFYRYKIHEEADEATPYLDPAIPITPEYLQEQADLFLTWMGLNRSMGVSYATAMQAVDLKLDELISRAEYASRQPNFRIGWDVKKHFPETE